MATGDSLGPYKLGALIGAGGMGAVYKARDSRLNRDVAIKVLPASFATDPERLRRFQTEARAAGALSHPNILTVFDAGLEGDTPYLVSELLEGEPLRDRMARGRLSLSKIADYGKQVAAGLAAAHDKGIVHRDIKPENLFLTRDGRIKILDFGLAKSKAQEPAEEGATQSLVTATGSVMGTTSYMSPEQVLAKGVDGRSDIFSLGCVLYEMATGVRPFVGDNAIAVMHGIVNDDPAELPSINPEVPVAFDRVVRHCLEKNPDDRFQSVRGLIFALDTLAQATQVPTHAGEPVTRRRKLWKILIPALCLLAGALAGVWYQRSAHPALKPVFQRLTFRRGRIDSARFTPDGGGVVYSAQWEDDPVELFDVRFDSPGARSLGFRGAELRAVSSSGELALSQEARVVVNSLAPAGLLARAPISGGAPRAVEEKIDFADWSPDGKTMAVVRETDTGTQLEYPVGKVLYRTAGYIGNPRISPSGDAVAFLDHPLAFDNGGDVAVIGRDGRRKTLARGFAAAEGLAWSPRGDEIWFSAARTGSRMDLRAVSLDGKERLVHAQSSTMVLHDIAKDGRVLVADTSQRTKLLFHGAGESGDHDLSWLDWSLVTGLSPNGKLLTFFESGDGAGAQPLSYLRETDGKPAVLLGPGEFPALSPDGRFVAVSQQAPSHIVLYPVGAGQARTFATTGYVIDHAQLLPDGQHLWFSGSQPSHGRRLYRLTMANGAIEPLSEEGINVGASQLLPDGQALVGYVAGSARLFHFDGRPPGDLPPLIPGERISGFTADGRAMFVNERIGLPAKVFRVDLASGRRELAFTIQPGDRAGVLGGVSSLQVTPDGRVYTYSLLQVSSELHVVEGLK
jgi:Tol biopolymer transport system component